MTILFIVSRSFAIIIAAFSLNVIAEIVIVAVSIGVIGSEVFIGANSFEFVEIFIFG
jgi:hypothetical protein